MPLWCHWIGVNNCKICLFRFTEENNPIVFSSFKESSGKAIWGEKKKKIWYESVISPLLVLYVGNMSEVLEAFHSISVSQCIRTKWKKVKSYFFFFFFCASCLHFVITPIRIVCCFWLQSSCTVSLAKTQVILKLFHCVCHLPLL